jgi:glyoxylase-like metal-dependent hydrolase (beta-lactamase superfamily II)
LSVSGATLRYFFSAIKSSFARANKLISRLDVLAITHAHADHMGGAAAILENFRPRELWMGDLSDPEIAPLLRQAAELGVRMVHYPAGDRSTSAVQAFVFCRRMPEWGKTVQQ